MKREDHKNFINQLLGMVSPDNQARASEILTNLSEDYEQTLTESETAANRIDELTKNNETLRDVNAKLFLKVGEIPKKTDVKPVEDDAPENKIGIADLFNEKGELI